MNSKKALKSTPAVLEALEVRVLYSADFLAAFGTGGDDHDLNTSLLSDALVDDDFAVQADGHDDLAQAGDATGMASEVLFVGAGVGDIDTLLDGLETNRSIDVVFLDPDQDSLAQISAVLGSYANLDAIHFVAHGSDGAVNFGGDSLDASSLAANRELIASWARALADDADILIYGCDLAANDAGRVLVDQLALLTGADVAASADLTGAADLGGDWDLEYSSGDIGVSIAFSESAQANWMQTLAVYDVSNLNASGVGSLAWAVAQANSDGALDTITFSVSGTITVSSGFDITKPVIIDGTSAPGYAGAPTISIDGSALGATAVGFNISGADGTTIQGLNIYGFDSGAIEVNSQVVVIADNYLGTNASGNALASTEIGEAVYVLGSGNDTIIRDNVVGGYAVGVQVENADRVNIQGNSIGIGADGISAIANGIGVFLHAGARDALIGTDGDTINDAAEGNIISGNTSHGIVVTAGGTDDSTIAGNLIGVRPGDNSMLGNGGDGIVISGGVSGATIGGVGTGNVIVGNAGAGITLDGAGGNTTITGNFIGTDSGATQRWGNLGPGIVVLNGGGTAFIGGVAAGEANVITNNGAFVPGGVVLDATAPNDIALRGNEIYDNFGPAIDLGGDGYTVNDPGDGDSGPNRIQNHPVIGDATLDGSGNLSVMIDTTSFGGGSHTIDFYASDSDGYDGHANAQRYLFSVVMTGGQQLTHVEAGVVITAGEYLSATASRNADETSEVSSAIVVTLDGLNSTPSDAWVSSTTGGGISLNEDAGNAAYLIAADGGAVFGGRTALTVEARIEFAANGQNQTLLSYDSDTDGSGDEFAIMLNTSGNLVIQTAGSSTVTSGYDFGALAGSPSTLSVAWDNSGQLSVYVNGTLEFSDATHAIGATIGSGGVLVVGQDQYGANNIATPLFHFNGTFYDLRVFDSARSSVEITENWGTTQGNNVAGLVANWTMDSLSEDSTTLDTVAGNSLQARTVDGAAWTSSEAGLTLSVADNVANGTVVGTVSGIDIDRLAGLENLLAADANLVYSPETGSFFRVDDLGVWTTSSANASTVMLNGVSADMAVITSASENVAATAAQNMTNLQFSYIGASDETTEGQWYWQSGGVDDVLFWQGVVDGSAVGGAYTNWYITNPNNLGDNEHYGVIADTGEWRDADDSDNPLISGALLEWDADAVLDVADALTYTFAPGGNAGGAFAIDSATGVITVADASLLDASVNAQEVVTVRVTDTLGANADFNFTIDIEGDQYPATVTAPATDSTDEDVDLVFSVANGNAVVVDTNSPYDPAITVTVSVANGTLVLGSTTNVTFMNGTTDGQATITIFGNESDINNALDGLVYTPDSDFFGSDALNVTTGVTDTGLAGNYSFEGGSLEDSSGNANHASLPGGTANPVVQADAERGDVLVLDGDDHLAIYGYIGDPTAITMSAWVNLDAGETDAVVLSIGDQLRLVLDSAGGAGIQLPGGGYGSLVDVAGTGWRHVAVTLDEISGNVVVYIDGQMARTFSDFMTTHPTGLNLASPPQSSAAIGHSVAGTPGLGNPMLGSLDDIRVYTRALSSAEIAAMAGDRGTSSASVALTINPVNDEQSLDTNLAATVTEALSIVIADTNLFVSDVDNTAAQIVYTVTTAPTDGRLELSTAVGVPITTFTQADIDAGIVVYVHLGGEAGSDSFAFDVDDGAGVVTSSSFTVNVDPVNDEESLDVNLGASVNEGANVTIDNTLLSTSDVDNTPAQIVYTVTTVPTGGRLELTTAPNVAITSFTQADIDAGRVIYVHFGGEVATDSFAFDVDDGAGTVTSSSFALSIDPVNDEESLDINLGASVNEGANVTIDNTLLSTSDADNTPAQIVYTVTTVPTGGRLELSSAPNVAITSFTQADIDAGLVIYVHLGGEVATDSFAFDVDDGAGTVTSSSFALSIDPVNDEESLDINLGASVTEGLNVTIDNTLLSTSDVDNTPAQIVYTVTTAPTGGQLELTTTPNVAITSFTQADIDAGLVIYVHLGGEVATDSFAFDVDDGAGTVTSSSFALSIDPVNDEESLDVNFGASVNEGANVTIDNTLLSTSDADNTPAQIVYTVTTGPTGGRLELTTAPNVAITSFTQADVDAGLVIYVHLGNEVATDSFAFDVDDGAGTVTSSSFALTIDPVNDEESLDINLGASVTEGLNVTIDNTLLSTSDVDNTPAQIVYTVTTAPTGGQLELTSAPNVAITSFTQADIDAGLVIYVHLGGEVATDSFAFDVDDGVGTVTSSSFALSIDPVNDEESLDINLGASVNEGANVTIDNTILSTGDVDNTPAQIVYTVTTGPTGGRLELTTAPNVAITSFTQADIDAGLVIYVHLGGEVATDSFAFDVDDGAGTVTSSSFALSIDPVNDEESLDINLGASVTEGLNVTIDNTLLSTSDVDNTPAQIVYTVTTAPTGGQLELTSVPNVAITSFTQADIDAGLVIYVHLGGEVATDSFAFDVDDGAGTVTSSSFALSVDPVNDEESLDINLGASVNEGANVTIDNTLLSTSDVDNTPAQIVYTVTTVPTGGRLELTTAPNVAITSFTQADIDAGLVIYVHLGNEVATDSFAFDVDDGAGTVTSSSFALSIDPVNDEESLDINLGASVTEGLNVTIDNTLLSTSDADNTPAQIVYTVTAAPTGGQLELTSAPNVAITSFTQADIDAGLVIYVHLGGEVTTDSFAFDVDDGSGTVTSESFSLAIDPVNDEESLDINLGASVTEGANVTIDNTLLSTSDVDNTPAQIVYTVTTAPAGGQLELTSAPNVAITSFTQADIDAGLVIYVHLGGEVATDSFAFDVDDGAGTVTSSSFALSIDPVNDEESLDINLGASVTEGSNVTIDNTILSTSDVDNTPAQIVYTVMTAPAGGQLELTSAPNVAITTFTQADIDAGLVIYVHLGGEVATDSFAFNVDDGAGTVTSSSFALSIDPVNDEESLDINLGASVTEGANVTIDNTVLSTSDADNTPAQIVYTVTTSPTGGQLELTSVPNIAITSFTQADINAGLVVYVHLGGEVTTDSFAFDVDDGAGTVTSSSFALSIDPVNDEESLDVNLGANVTEGLSVTIDNTVLSTSDVDNTPAQIVYTVTTAPTGGQLELTSAPNVAITSFTQADIDAGLVIYVHLGGEVATDSFAFDVDDGAGTVTSSSFALSIDPVNDEESLDVNLGANVTEGLSVTIDNTVLSTSDVDNTPAQIVYTVTTAPTGGQLELTSAPNVAITSFTQADINAGLVIYVHLGGEVATDSFAFDVDDGTGTVTSSSFALSIDPVNDEESLDINLGTSVTEGANVTIDNTILSTSDVDNTPAQIVYTVTTAPTGGQLELTTTPNVAITSFTQADIDAGLVIYVHLGGEVATDSFAFNVDDGAGTVTSSSFALSIDPVNDEESLDINLGASVTEGANVTIDNTLLSTSDVDNTPAQIVYTVTTAPTGGQLELTSAPNVAITSFTQADINAGLVIYVHLGGEVATDSFAFDVDDGAGTVTSSSFALTIDPVNDEESLDVNLGANVTEGANVTIDNTLLSTSDVDNAPAQIVYTVTTAPTGGQLELTSVPNVAITSFTQADIDAGLVIYVHLGGEVATDSFAFDVDDGAGTVTSSSFALSIDPVNDEESLDINLGASVTEGANVTIDNTLLSTSDVDNTPVQIVYTVTTAPAGGQLELTSAPNVAITSFTQADIDAGLVIYVHLGGEVATDSFAFDVDDGAGTVTSSSFALSIDPVNDEESLDINLGASVTEGANVTIDNTLLSTSDVDNTPAQIVYTVTTVPTGGQLELTSAPNVAITTFTQADIDAGLVIYVHLGGEVATDSFAFDVDDGAGTVTSSSFALSIDPVNDEESLDINLGASVTEGANVTIDNTLLSTSDVDNTPAQIVYTVTTVPTGGQLELTSAPNVAITTFTQADIDAGLVIYVHLGGEVATDSFAFNVDDGAGTVTSSSFALSINPVNDEESLDINLGASVTEGSNVTIDSTLLSTSDVDNTSAQIVYTVTTAPTGGQLELTTAPNVAITSFTQADIDAGLVIYVHLGGEVATDSFAFDVDDGAGTVTSSSFALSIDPVNDEESLDINLGASVTEGSNVTIDNTLLSTSDVDNTPAQIVYTVTTVPTGGQLELTSAPNVAITSFTQADVDAGLVIYVHLGGEVATDSFTFDVDDGAGTVTSSSFALSIDPVNDEESLDTNLGASVTEGAIVTIDSTLLSTSDVDNTSAQIVYTVTTAPTGGQLELTTAPNVAITSFTQADIDAGLVIYVHLGGEVATDSFAFDVDDGAGTVTSSSFALSIDPVNDEESLDINLGANVSEGSNVTIDNTVLSTSDADNTPAQIVYTVTTVPTGGQLELTSAPNVAITSFTQADVDAGLVIYVHLGGEVATDSFTFDVDDGAGTVTSSSFALSIDPVNDEESLDSNFGASVNEGATVTIDSTLLSTSDADNTPAQIVYTVTTAPAGGQLELTSAAGVAITTFTQADLDAGLVVYVHGGGEVATDSFAFDVDDGAGTVISSAFTLAVNPVNDDPTNAGSLPLRLSVVEDIASTLDLSALVLNDSDAGIAPLSVTLSSIAGGQLTVVAPGGVSVGGNGSDSLVLTGSLAQLNALFADPAALEYLHSVANTNGNGADTLRISVSDNGGSGAGGGGSVALGDITIDIVAVNDAPQNLGALPATHNGIEDTSHALDLTAFNLADVDSNTLTLTLATASGGRLFVSPDPGIAVTGNDSASLSVSGTIDALNALFADTGRITYQHDTPDLFGTGVDQIAATLADDTGLVSELGDFNVDISGVNDAPQIMLDSTTAQAIEQTVLELHGMGISIADVDVGSSLLTLELVVDSGNVSVNPGASGVAVVAGNDSQRVTLSGTLSAINSLFAGDAAASIEYIHPSDTPPASATLTLSADDNGAVGMGGAQRAIAMLPISLQTVDDQPIVTVAGSPSGSDVALDVVEGQMQVAGLNAVDVDSNEVAFAIVGGADASAFNISANGSLSFNNPTVFELPGDADGNGVYEVQIAGSDGNSADVRTLTIAVSPQSSSKLAAADVAPTVQVTLTPAPIDADADADEESDEEVVELADVLSVPQAAMAFDVGSANTVTLGAEPVAIELDDSIIASIAPRPDDDGQTDTKAGHSMDLLRDLLKSAPKSPLSFPVSLVAQSFDSRLDSGAFADGIALMRESLDEVAASDKDTSSITTGVAVGATASLTVGFIGWVLRAGSLITGFLSAAPLWRHLDPLAVLAGRKSRKDGDGSATESQSDDRKLERMFRRRGGEG